MNQIQQVAGKIASHEKTPLVLTIISCAGVVGTAVLTARAAPKASRILYELQEEKRLDDPEGSDHISLWEATRATWSVYVPAASFGLATIATIVTMNRITDRNMAILTAGATLATNTLKDYQQHILEEIGGERESKVRDRVARDKIAKSTLPESEVGFIYTDGNVLFFDALSGRYFQHNAEKVRRIENEFNRDMLMHGSAALNDLYEELGLEPIDIGDVLGFNTDNMLDFHFSAQLTPEKKPAVVLSHINMPRPDYER